MGQDGSPSSIASIESCIVLLKRNGLNHQSCRTRDDLHISIVPWIKRTYPRGPARHRSVRPDGVRDHHRDQNKGLATQV